MSRKRLKGFKERAEEHRLWHEQVRRQREEAIRQAEAQHHPVPGFHRLSMDEEF